MINGYKIIGLCITRINAETCMEFAEQLSVEAIENGYRLLIYNSFRDFYHNDNYDVGARSIYQGVNFDILDALVIDCQTFHDKSIIEELIEKAKMRQIPVVLINEERDDCFCIMNDYKETYKSLIRHIIKDHGARKLNFIAGRQGEMNSELRLECYKEVLEEYDIPFETERVEYGDYWTRPVCKAVDKWLNSEEPLPDAIICVNDASAVDVCDHLAQFGYKVPRDVIVTGFDGLRTANLHTPQLTTCCKDNAGFAKSCMKLIRMGLEENCAPCTIHKRYGVIFSESCGCPLPNVRSFRDQASILYRNLIETNQHEEALYSWADRIVDNTDLGSIGENLNDHILPGSSVCLNNNFLSSIRMGEKTNPEAPFTTKMISVATKDDDYKFTNQEIFPLNDMYPQIEKYISENVMFVFQSIYVADKVCGYYAVKTPSLNSSAHKIHRLTRIMNIAFGTLVGCIEQNHMISRIEDMQYRDTFTELLNLKGLKHRMEEIADFARTKRMAVSVYSIAQYKYIYENYGLKDVEEAVALVSDSLQLANPSNSIVARIADDEFAVINLEEPEVDMDNVIVNTVAIFFGNTESYNSSQNKEYYIEVNCGCTIADPGWDGSIESFLKVASGDLYLNRLKSGNGPVMKEKTVPKEFYRLFEILVKNNLFDYHFQPIVNAQTGEIYAYEALMRTHGEINMNPGEILEIAAHYKRLYEIECISFNNILDFVDKHPEEFKGKKVFINTIPGHFLKQAEYDSISRRYGHILKTCVIEITEQGEITDEELSRIKDFGGKASGCQLAIDDYGSGASNIVNLLRYSPQVVKIDRFLISGIQNDINKQMFVMNVIDFAQMNDIMTVAEGVETKEELDAVISYGVDLIQGFYTALPSPDPLQELPENILNDIRDANIKRV